MKNNELWRVKEFSLEDFMKSITYPPECMTTNLARKQINESETGKLSAPMREATILDRAIELLPIGIHEQDIIAGNYGTEYTDKEKRDAIDKADREEYQNSEEYKVWDEEERTISGRYMLFGIYTPSHTCVNYESILNNGLKGYEAQIKERLSRDIDAYGAEYLKAMLKTIETTRHLSHRYIEKIKEAKKIFGKDRTFYLDRMQAALEKIPYEPARDFFEALQSMWIIHIMTPASERSWASVSLGRMDKYLLPYYQDWLKSGHTEEEAKELLLAFFKLLDSYGDGSCALNLGPDWNELSRLFIKVEKESKRRSPIIAVRLNDNTPEDIYNELIQLHLFEMGQPTFYNEDACIRAMNYRGMSEKDEYSVNSCMGNVIVGKELADMWGTCMNMNIPLELAINEGRPLHGEFPPSLQTYIEDVIPLKPVSIEAVKKNYEAYTKGVMKYVAHQNMKKASWIALNRPNPFLSMLLEGCVEYGRDRAHSAVKVLQEEARPLYWDSRYDFEDVAQGRGAKYHNVTTLAMGFAHAADALTAIEELVYRKKEYTLEELKEAAKNNYESDLKSLKIFSQLRKCPKYADGSDQADRNAVFVLNALADAAEMCYDGNIKFLPTCHTIDANVQFGNCVYASLDSRKSGEPFGKNAGPVLMAIKNAPTDLMVSAGKLPQFRYSGGVPIDIYVSRNILETEENRNKFEGMLKAYLSMGGMQVQVNSVNVELLKKAYSNPEEYPHVIVRKGGFSIYFTDMLKEVQKDMIDRFEMECKNG
mgnify:CR=1 FL=1